MTTSSDFVFARASRANQMIRLLGELLITLGVIVFLFIGYELWFTGLYTEHAQSQLNHQLKTLWAAPPTPTPSTTAGPASSASPSAPVSGSPGPTSVPAASVPTIAPIALPGDAIGIIRIPRLGTKYGYAIVEGVSTADLKKGPGHYPGTANPGGTGNFVVSGHRTTYLAPFNGLGELVVGDAIVIETRDTWYTYRGHQDADRVANGHRGRLAGAGPAAREADPGADHLDHLHPEVLSVAPAHRDRVAPVGAAEVGRLAASARGGLAMYEWLWRKLPGGFGGKLTGFLALLVGRPRVAVLRDIPVGRATPAVERRQRELAVDRADHSDLVTRTD